MEGRELEVREKLERTLGRQLPGSVWEKLIDNGCIEEYLNPDHPFSWEELRDHVASELRYADNLVAEHISNLGEGALTRTPPSRRPQSPSDKPDKPDHFKVSFTSWEVVRSEAHAMHVADLANRNLHVQAFREEVLGEAYPLDRFWAHELVSSPAAAFFPVEWFQNWGVPVVGHFSEIAGKYFDNRRGREVDHRVTVQFDRDTLWRLPGRSWLALKRGKIRARYALGPPPSTDKIDVQRVERRITSIGTDAVSPKADFILSPGYERPRPDYLWPGSVLAELKKQSKKLARLYWQAEGGEISAAWFILTGKATLVLPLEVETKVEPQRRYTGEPQLDWLAEERPAEASIRLTVQPWVSADRVRAIYNEVQRQIVQGAKQPWEKNLKVYIFVKENGLEDREGESEPFDMYNAQAPEEERYTRPHGFWQAYKNAREKVENFNYRRPGR